MIFVKVIAAPLIAAAPPELRAFWEASALRSITLAPDVIVPVELSFGKCNWAKSLVVIDPPTDVTLSRCTIVVPEAVMLRSPVRVVPSIS